ISKVGGRKALLGKGDREVEISNQCGRLLAAVVIFYNAYLNVNVWRIAYSLRSVKMLRLAKELSSHVIGLFS
ncbi:hypothetical protein EBR43_11050, partial [bacterium]|nr:hypothetical protein [bacterium]